MNIQGRRVVLRAIEEADLPQFNEWGNDPDLWRMLGGWHFPASMKSTQKWFEGLQGDQKSIRLAITTATDGVIGLVNLVDLDWKNSNAFHGMMLGDPAMRGKGLGQDVVMAIMRYAFDQLGLNRLDSSIIEYNHPSLRLYLGKCGWIEEGRKRQWYFRDGRWWDCIMIGVLAEDYRKLAVETGYWG